MASFISSYKGILCFLRYTREKNDVLNSFVAGSFALLSILLDNNKSRRTMIALYLSTRTFHFIARWLWRHHVYKLFGNSHTKKETTAVKNVKIILKKMELSLNE
jgi:hypothetical protein